MEDFSSDPSPIIALSCVSLSHSSFWILLKLLDLSKLFPKVVFCTFGGYQPLPSLNQCITATYIHVDNHFLFFDLKTLPQEADNRFHFKL